MVKLTIDMSLMRMLSAGPLVSLNGSPTVSPTTHALPWSVFLSCSFSHSFLELSQAPPAFDIVMAFMHPQAMAPASTPIRQRGPIVNPTMRGIRSAYRPGAIISLMDDFVDIF